MKANTIYQLDCRGLIAGMPSVDYVFTVPPDFEELCWHPENDLDKYVGFVCDQVLEPLVQKSPVITVGITDRKCLGRIVPKHHFILQRMMARGCQLVGYKIWMKSDKINLYRLNFLHLMTFSRVSKPKQNWPRDYRYDVFRDELRKVEGYNYGIPEPIVLRHIQNFMQPGQIVFDPFMGSGTTAAAALSYGARYVGSEISGDAIGIARRRLAP